MPPRSPGWRISACLELHPHPVRAEDLDHPDELRVDLDPVPGIRWEQVRDVAEVVRATLEDWHSSAGRRHQAPAACTSYVRIQRRWTFDEVRRAALALAREVERRAPGLATSKWWKEERHGVFLDYNQNAKDRTVAAAYSVRPTPDARVSAPLTWDEVADCDPRDFTLVTMPARFAAGRRSARGDRRAAVFAGQPCSSCRRSRNVTGSATRRGRRTTASRRASRRACSPPDAATPSLSPLIEIGRRSEKMTRSPVWSAGAPAIRKPRRISRRGRAGRLDARASSTWTRIRVNLKHVPEDCGPPQETLDPDEDPG